MKTYLSSLCTALILLMFAAPAFATVFISQPGNGDTVGSPVQFAATGNTTCWKGVGSMGVYINNSLKYVHTGSSLNTSIGLGAGTYNAVVVEWDNCGGATSAASKINVGGQSGVYLASPANNSTVGSPAKYSATASTSTCAQGVAAMGVWVDNSLRSKVGGSQLNTQVAMSSGTHHTVVQAWDNCGGSTTATADITVSGSSTASGNVLWNLQAAGSWNQWGELPPSDNICNPCSGVSWYMQQHVSNPSYSGNATKFVIGGWKPYSDALWSNKIMGQGSTQNLYDTNHTLIPNLHNFIYDTDVYVSNPSVTQSLEFDVNMYLYGVGMEWGTQCNHLGDGDWDVWDNVNAHWDSTGAPCKLNYGWNHVTIQVQRESNNNLLYQTITVNGVTYNIYKTYAPFGVPYQWYGMTVNYQMDGNYSQAWNTTYLDNFSLRYW